MVKISDPTHISIFVLSPATLFFFSISHPTIAPHIVATSTFKHIGRIIDNSLLNNCLIESFDSVDQLDPLNSTLSLKTGVIVTVELGKTNKIDISRTIKILQRADQNLIGLVAIAGSQRMLSALYK